MSPTGNFWLDLLLFAAFVLPVYIPVALMVCSWPSDLAYIRRRERELAEQLDRLKKEHDNR